MYFKEFCIEEQLTLTFCVWYEIRVDQLFWLKNWQLPEGNTIVWS